MILDVEGKKVLLRVDFNVPIKDGTITDDTRIRAALPTIMELLEAGAAIILCSHLGRPQKKRLDDGSIDRQKFTLHPVAEHVTEVCGIEVQFANDTIGEDAQQKVADLRRGQILLLENTRFEAGEEKGDKELAKSLANFADVYINDAFGTAHRRHASTAVVADYFEAENKGFGKLMSAELANARKVMSEGEKPQVAILGGAKVSDKIGILERFIDICDEVIIGGAMAYTFFKAQGGSVGNSLVEDEKLDLAREILQKAKEQNTTIHLPQDSRVASAMSADVEVSVSDSAQIADGFSGFDIGPISEAAFRDVILQAKTIIWNGPMGVFEIEQFSQGTRAIAQAVADATAEDAYSLVGGGDSVAALKATGRSADVSYVSTGGGALLELLEGKSLPGVAAIESPQSFLSSMKNLDPTQHALRETNLNLDGQSKFYRGKVRDVYTVGDRLVMVASDRISAFDHVLPRAIPYKGQVLNQIAASFLEATSDIVPNWVEASPDANVTIGKACETYPVEMVVRGYLTGHAWRTYRDGGRVLCGVPLPEGMKEHDRFPEPIITPTTKAEIGHDEDITREEILAQGLVSEAEYKQLEEFTLALFKRGTEMAAERGLILVDTKYEFGKADGKIYLIDEVHTPDSSRYFYLDGYQDRQDNGQPQKQLSKEFVREWLIENGFQGKEGQAIPEMPDDFVWSVSERYIELYESILGKKFEKADTNNISARIEQNIKSAIS